jgi:hypothetical protein
MNNKIDFDIFIMVLIGLASSVLIYGMLLKDSEIINFGLLFASICAIIIYLLINFKKVYIKCED